MTGAEFSALVVAYGAACHDLGVAFGVGDDESVPGLLRKREEAFERLLVAGLHFDRAQRFAS